MPSLFDAGVSEVVADNGGRVRSTDPETSKAAARTVKAGTQRARILTALVDASNGLNGWEAAVRCGIFRVHGATTRLEELEELGMVRRDGSTRPTDSGKQALIFYATDAGRTAAAELARSAA